MARVHAAFFKLSVVVASFGAKGEKAHEYFLVACFLSLGDQNFGTVRVFEVYISAVSPCVAGNEFISVVDADPVRICFERQVCPGIFCWNGVMVRLNAYPELRGGTHLRDR